MLPNSVRHRRHTYHAAHARHLPSNIKSWILHQGSLTKALILASNGNFKVKLLSQTWQRPAFDEARVLKQSPHLLAQIREVVLWGCGKPWIYARSVLPAATLKGSLAHLKKLGTRPLGAILFSDPSMQRGALEFACLNPDSIPLPTQSDSWGRRSVFTIQGKDLLVSEIFLPTFLTKDSSKAANGYTPDINIVTESF